VRISRTWFSKLFEKMGISSRYAQTVLPISPARMYSLTRLAVEGALVSPCSIILDAKGPKCILMVLRVLSSGGTRIWKYQVARAIVHQYLALATLVRTMDSLGILLSFLIVISFLGTRSSRSLISPLGLRSGNMWKGLLASQGAMIFFTFQVSIICLNAGRILSGTVHLFGLGAIFPLIRLRWWLIWRKSCSSVIFWAGKRSGNSEMNPGVFEFVIRKHIALFPFLQVWVFPFFGH